jgi:hypothetical protein
MVLQLSELENLLRGKLATLDHLIELFGVVRACLIVIILLIIVLVVMFFFCAFLVIFRTICIFFFQTRFYRVYCIYEGKDGK